MLDRIPLGEINEPITRAKTAQKVHGLMSHFPDIVELMHDIQSTEPPLPSDSSICANCELALSVILLELHNVLPAPSGRITSHEEAIHGWLSSSQTREALGADTLHRFDESIGRIFRTDWSPFG